MDLVLLCLLAWLWTPGAAPPRPLGGPGDLPRVRDVPGRARSCTESGAQSGPPLSASDRKANISQAARRRRSPPFPAEEQAAWDFVLAFLALALAALALVTFCCFPRRCPAWIPPTWQGWADNRGPLPRTASLNSAQRSGAFAARPPQTSPVAESSCGAWFVPSALHREASAHLRRPSTPKDGPASLFAAAPGSGAGRGPASETILEMEDEF